jgi:hypothetical protein
MTCLGQAPRRAAYPTNKTKEWRGLATRYDKVRHEVACSE